MSAAGIRAGRAFIEIGADDSGLRGVLQRAEQRFQQFGSAAVAVGMKMAGIGLAMAAPLGLATKAYAGFEQGMADTRAVLGLEKTSEAFQALTAEAMRLGAETQFSAADAARGMYNLSKAGLQWTDTLKAMGPVLDLAAAGHIEVKESSDILMSVMGGMGIGVGRLTEIMNKLATASVRANTSISEIGLAFEAAGPAAKKAGWTFDETLALIMNLANAGIKGEKAGVGIRAMVAGLTSPSGPAADAMRTLGVNIGTTGGKIKSATELIEEMANGFRRLSDVAGAQVSGALFTNVSETSASILTSDDPEKGTGGDRMRKALAELDKGAREGKGFEIAHVQTDTLTGALELLMSSLEGVGIVVGRALAPTLREWGSLLVDATNWVAMVAEKNDSWVPIIAKTSVGLVGVGTALMAVGTVANLAAFSIGGLTKAWAGLKVVALATGSAMQLALLPVTGLVSVASASLGVLKVAAVAALSPVATLGAAGAWLGTGFAAAGAGIVSFASAIGGAVVAVGSFLSTAASALTVVGVIGTIAVAALGLVAVWGIFTQDGREAFAWLGGQIVNLWDGVVGTVTSAALSLAGMVVGAASVLWSGVKSVATAGVAALNSVVSGLGNGFVRVWDGLLAGAGFVWKGIVGLASGAVVAIKGVWDGVGDFFGGVWSGIKSSAAGVWKFLGDGWVASSKFLGDAWSGIADAIRQGELGAAANIAWKGVVAVFTAGVGQVQILWNDVTGWFIKLWADATDGVAKLFVNLWADVQKGWLNTIGTIKGSLEGIGVKFVKGIASISETIQNIDVAGRLAGGQIGPEQAAKEYKRIEEEGKFVQGDIGKDLATANAAAESFRAKELERINAGRAGRVEKIDAARAAADAGRAEERAKLVTAADGALTAAVDDFEKALRAVAEMRAAREKELADKLAGNAPPEPGQPQRPGMPNTDQVMQMISGPSYGTFSAEALQAVLGSGREAEGIALGRQIVSTLLPELTNLMRRLIVEVRGTNLRLD